MADAALRQVLMLRKIPSEPRRISIAELVSYLKYQEGFAVTERTVQRDLVALSSSFDLVCDTRSKPYGWSYSRGKTLGIPVMDMTTALALDMAGQHLQGIVPQSVLRGLEPQLNQARKRLATLQTGQGSGRVLAIPEGQRYPNLQISPQNLEMAYQAVFEERELEVDFGEGKQTCQPLGIITRGRVPYLVASFSSEEEIKQIALHKVTKIRVLNKRVRKLAAGFDLRDYLQEVNCIRESAMHYRLHASCRSAA